MSVPYAARDRLDAEVAVIGAGIAGLACARELRSRGKSVLVFDKGRAPGGRASTRREGDLAFDHGAQYFTARDALFRAQTDRWVRAGLVARWFGAVHVLERGVVTEARGEAERFVGVPTMSALAKDLARGIDVRCGVKIESVARASGTWKLISEGTTFGPFDALVVTAPAIQTAALVAHLAPSLAERANTACMRPCWAVMLEFAAPLECGFDAAFVVDSPLAWIARDSSKPGRAPGERWVLHASSAWTEANLDLTPEQAAVALLAAFTAALGTSIPEPRFARAHRWMFALPDPPLAERSIGDDALALFAGGDWCGGPRVEGAFSSGLALAERVLALR